MVLGRTVLALGVTTLPGGHGHWWHQMSVAFDVTVVAGESVR
jgi:hypothetical protein